MTDTNTNSWFLPVIVLLVVGTTVYLAVRNNSTDVVYSLCTAIFGYYFGQKTAATNKNI